ncbi:MAG: DUF3127 domain-containing protein [Prevotella sp.]
MQFTGVIKKVFDLRSGTSQRGTQWQSQSYLIEEVGNRFNQSVVFDVFGEDRINEFALAEGLMVEVSLELTTNEWQGKFYNKVSCYAARPIDDGHVQPQQPLFKAEAQQAPAAQPSQPAPHSVQAPVQHNDDLPF